MTERPIMNPAVATIKNPGIAIVLAALIISLGAFGTLFITAPNNDEPKDDDPWEPTPHQPYIQSLFSGLIAEHFVAEQLNFGYRVPGTETHDDCRDFIRDTMIEFGYDVEYQDFTHEDTQGTNIISRSSNTNEFYSKEKEDLNGTGSNERKKLILGAHYDSRPFTGTINLTNEPIMGANDGGSGVAVLLELARVFSVRPIDLDLEFVFFDLEDSGKFSLEYAIGSKYYAESLTEEEKSNILQAIVVDMVGDSELDIYYEKNSDPQITQALWSEADKLDYKEFHHTEKYNMFDDHKRLIDVGIDTALLIDFDYPYWHTQEDTLDKISGESLEKVGRVIEQYLYTLTKYNKIRAPEDDLNIPAGSSLTIENTVKHINGDVTIEGELNIKNSMLIVNGEDGFEHLINVSSTGSLIIDNSIITSPERSIIFQNFGSLLIESSLIEHLWGNDEIYPYEGGLQLYTPNFLIANSTIQYSQSRGIYMDSVIGKDEPSIISTAILDNGEVGIFLQDSFVSGINLTMEGNGMGNIEVNGGGILVADSTIGECFHGGTCTTGSCIGPDPTFGIELNSISRSSTIQNTKFTTVDKGIVVNFANDNEGEVTIQNNNFQNMDWGVESLHSPIIIENNSMFNTDVGIFLQNSDATVNNNTISNSLTSIYSILSSGTISDNQVEGVEYYGIAISRSTVTVSRNSVANALAGMQVTDDRGSRINVNDLYDNIFGMEISTESALGNTTIENNTIARNSWGMYIFGDDSSIHELNTSDVINGTGNTGGILWQEQELGLGFRNNTDNVTLTISSNGTVRYQGEMNKYSYSTSINITVLQILPDSSRIEYTEFSIEATSGGVTINAVVDLSENRNHILEF